MVKGIQTFNIVYHSQLSVTIELTATNKEDLQDTLAFIQSRINDLNLYKYNQKGEII